MNTISIIGLGLMGGSLAAACRKKFPKARIIGITRDKNALRLAKRKGWIHEGYTSVIPERFLLSSPRKRGSIERSMDSRFRGNDKGNLIILCTPVETFPKYLTLINEAGARHAVPLIVTDVGSVKGEILNWYKNQRFKNIQFVGAHPMVGSHKRGMHAARPDLYEHGFTFVVKNVGAGPRARPRTVVTGAHRGAPLRQVENFWRKICPHVIEISAEEHDKIVSAISHLPHAVAVALILSVPQEYFKFAAGGFLDTTRIAAGHPSIWLPIFLQNRKKLLIDIKKFKRTLARLEKWLATGRKRRLLKMLELASQRRTAMSLRGA